MKTKSRKVKVTVKYIKNLKDQIEFLEKERREIESDRAKFREFYIKQLKATLNLLASDTSYNTRTLSLELSKLLTNVKPWYWG